MEEVARHLLSQARCRIHHGLFRQQDSLGARHRHGIRNGACAEIAHRIEPDHAAYCARVSAERVL
jgi:hypothetical protein